MLTYVVASKCYKNHFISMKYKTAQSFKLHILQNSPLGQLYTSASYCKGVGNIPGNNFMKPFQLFIRILSDVIASQKRRLFSVYFCREKIKYQLQPA